MARNFAAQATIRLNAIKAWKHQINGYDYYLFCGSEFCAFLQYASENYVGISLTLVFNSKAHIRCLLDGDLKCDFEAGALKQIGPTCFNFPISNRNLYWCILSISEASY